MPPTALPPVLAFTPRGHPVLAPWRHALADELRVEGVTGVDGADFRRRCLGLAPRDAAPPYELPLAPWGEAWRPGHGRWLRRRWPAVRAVIFTRPDQAPLLPAFADTRRFYFAHDDYATYPRDWLAAERTMLAACERAVGVSTALAAALRERAGDRPPARGIDALPNAIPAAWRPPAPPAGPAPLPEGLRLPRPLAGVLGRVSSRLRLDWILDALERVPGLHWVFVGDIEWAEVAPEDRPRIERLRRHPRCTLLGERPFAAMRDFAAALDMAVLPYSARSTNPCGSPVRLFVHLPQYAPLVATPGCAQVAEFAAAVTLAPTVDDFVAALRAGVERGEDDSRRAERWQLSAAHTWRARARAWRDFLDA